MSSLCQHIDLHAHSTASDGQLSPTELVREFDAAGIRIMSLTDHDTVAGISEAQIEAQARGMTLIPGVEISVSWKKKTLHIVGLGIDPNSSMLTRGLHGLQQQRLERAELIAARLRTIGVPDAMNRAVKQAQGGQITRTHFARLLVEDGLVSDMKQAFKRYLRTGKPACVSIQWADLEQSISWIHAAKGVAVLAHPMRYPMTAAWRRRTIDSFKAAGGQALEVITASSSDEERLTASQLARDYELLASVGSDFHGPEQRWIRLGKLHAVPTGLEPVWNHSALKRHIAIANAEHRLD